MQEKIEKPRITQMNTNYRPLFAQVSTLAVQVGFAFQDVTCRPEGGFVAILL
jgi:hypothetical protein